MKHNNEAPTSQPSSPTAAARQDWSSLLDNIMKGNTEAVQQQINELFTSLVGGFLPASWLQYLGIAPKTEESASTPTEDTPSTSPPSSAPTTTVEHLSSKELGPKITSVAQRFLGMPYKFGGRPNARSAKDFAKGDKVGFFNTAINTRYNGNGVDCSGLWWAVWRELGFTDKHGKPLTSTFFSKDGFHGMIPALSPHYDTYNLGTNVTKAVETIQQYPPGTLIAFSSHVGIVGPKGFLNAQGGISKNGRSFGPGVIEGDWSATFRNFASKAGGCSFRVLKPEYLSVETAAA